MKREDATIIVRAIAIGLFSLLVLAMSAVFVAFVFCARQVEAEFPW
jgi:hypothetical protein